MKRIIGKLLVFTAIISLIIPAKDVYADNPRYVPNLVTDTEMSRPDLYVERACIENALDCGNDYKILSVYYATDLTKVDAFQFTYKTWLQACNCQKPNVVGNGKITYLIGGVVTGQVNDDEVLESYSKASTRWSAYTDIYRYGTGKADTVFCSYSQGEKCQTCGLWCNRVVATKDMYLFDYRGVCIGIDSFSADDGDSIVIKPSYNLYTEKVDYKIRYEGESTYSYLLSGTERNGMNVSIGADRSITLSNVNSSKGSFDILPVPYDRNGQLPYGFNESLESKVSHITFPDKQKPTITQLESTYDRTKGSVTVGFTASDNLPLPSDCFSFDGGTYSSINTHTYTEPGLHTISVRDASNNITVKEFSILDSDVAKNVTILDKKNEDDKGEREAIVGIVISSPSTNSGGTTTANPKENTDNSSADSIKKVSSGVLNPNDSKESITSVTTGNKGEQKDGLTSSGNVLGSSNSKKSDTNSNKKPSTVSDSTKKSLFESVKENSGEYVLSQEEINKGNELKKAAATPQQVEIEEVNDDENIEMEESLKELAERTGNYAPTKNKSSVFYVLIISLILILLVMLLIFILFFMVLLFEEVDDGLIKKKKLLAVRILGINKKYWSLNLNELLSEHPTLEAHLGILFVYIFEGEYMKILSKVKGDDKREIAREEIKRVVIIGKGRGKRR